MERPAMDEEAKDILRKITEKLADLERQLTKQHDQLFQGMGAAAVVTAFIVYLLVRH
jgi:hypothetical protein